MQSFSETIKKSHQRKLKINIFSTSKQQKTHFLPKFFFFEVITSEKQQQYQSQIVFSILMILMTFVVLQFINPKNI